MLDIPKMKVKINGQTYKIKPLKEPLDISKHNEVVHPTFITHKIKGLESELYIVSQEFPNGDLSFFFGQFLGDTGLFLTLDESNNDVIELANKIVFEALKQLEGDDENE